MLKPIYIGYALVTAGFALYATMAQEQPALFFIEFFAPDEGDKFSATLVFLILYTIFLIPILFMQLVQRIVRSISAQPLDTHSTGVFIHRKKALQSALIGVPIFINGKKVGVVDNGKTRFFALSPGKCTIQAGTGKHASIEITESLVHGEQLYFTLRLQDAGLRVKIELEMMDRALL